MWAALEPILRRWDADVLEPVIVDAFDLADVTARCGEVMDRYPDAHWICNVTCATKIMSIGAYEAGKARNTDVWYVDSAHRRVISLVNRTPPRHHSANRSITWYLEQYQYKVMPTKPPPKSWVNLARMMVKNPDDAIAFREQLQRAKANEKFSQPRWLNNPSLILSIQPWLHLMKQAGFIEDFQQQKQTYSIYQFHPSLWKFFSGDWLEIFAWESAQNAKCFDDVGYGIKVHITGQTAAKEIDLAALFTTSLLIAECKTERKPFKIAHLDKFTSIADMCGGDSVVKLYVTARSRSTFPANVLKLFDDQAKARNIVVITGEQLNDLANILKREINQPTYPRI
jgi:hypothetical protein